MSTLNPPQQYVVDAGLLESGFNCVLQMPTGTGKTWLAELAMASAMQRGRRVIYLSPLRALANELGDRWRERFRDVPVGVFTGETMGPGRTPERSPLEAQLLVMTPERLDACTRSWRSHWAWIPEVDLLIVDELHLLGDAHRGPRLEGAILRMLRLNPFLRLLGLSATLGNRVELANWLKGVEFHSAWRSIPVHWVVEKFRKASDKPALMAKQVQRCVQQGGKSLIFVQSRRRAEQLAQGLLAQGIRAAHHHAGLESAERRETERRYRAGEIDALLSTGTLEMGLNLPVRQVVLYDLQGFNGSDFIPLTINTVWQRAGRAGRPGLDEHGEVVLLSPGWTRDAERYLRPSFEPILSGLSEPRSLAEQVLAEVGSGLCRTRAQLCRVMRESLAHHQGRLADVGKSSDSMLRAGMLSEEDGILRTTRLGRIAVRQMLSPESVLHLAGWLKREDSAEFSFLDLLLVAASAPDCESDLSVDFEDLDELSEALASEQSHLLRGPHREVVGRLALPGRRLLGVLKKALVARAWTRAGDAALVARALSCYPYEVTRLAESMERLLTACVAILAPEMKEGVPVSFSPLYEKARALLAMVQHGVDEECVTLTFIKGIGATLASRLLQAGISDIEALANSEADEVAEVRGISAERAARWVAEAEGLLSTRSAFHFRETGPTLSILFSGWPVHLDPYRLRRAADLTVKPSRQAGLYQVTGGLEPHLTSATTCDCPDHSRGRICKHRLAVQLHEGESETVASLRLLQERGNELNALDLFDLWLSQPTGRL